MIVWARFLGLAAVGLLVGSFVVVGLLDAPDGEGADAYHAAVEDRAGLMGGAGALMALAGLALVGFLAHVSKASALPAWCLVLGAIWGGAWILGGMVWFAAAESGGYYGHAAGTMTMGLIGYHLVVNPVGAMLGGTFAMGFARHAGKSPRWLTRASWGLGSIGLAGAGLGSLGGVGLVGLGPVVLWLVMVATWTAVTAVRSVDAVPPSAEASA